ncbi:hypothetical protein CsSME_00031454 [Camellia sinensis var. sinensis]
MCWRANKNLNQMEIDWMGFWCAEKLMYKCLGGLAPTFKITIEEIIPIGSKYQSFYSSFVSA